MANIAILTSSFPYPPGEQFFEEEIEYWAKSLFHNIYILPASAKGAPRSVPAKITIDTGIAQKNLISKACFAFKSLFSSIFFKEISYLFISKNICLYNIALAYNSTSNVLFFAGTLRNFIKVNGQIDMAYCYWNEAQAYAACLIKKEGGIRKVVSRAHGYDLYEERRKSSYMPLKRQFIPLFDYIFALSNEGRSYLISKYNCDPRQVRISPLGVSIPEKSSTPTRSGFLHVVSVSFCVPVKRIDKLIQALTMLAEKKPSLQIKWTHIGDGPLFDRLQNQAHIAFTNLKNVSFDFKGRLPNKSVKKFYTSEPIDIFINTSESEGIPVSIMEAMSYEVPSIAPNIGGISSLLNKNCGVLLDKNPSIDDIKSALENFIEKSKTQKVRSQAKNVVLSKYNSQRNYTKFIQTIYKGIQGDSRRITKHT